MFTLFQHVDATDRHDREIARLAAYTTLQRLHADTTNMSAAELRGYVRAHVQHVVREQFANDFRGISNIKSDDKRFGDIIEQTVHLVVRDLYVQPATLIPALHVPARMAA
jgi:hypothetical protein